MTNDLDLDRTLMLKLLDGSTRQSPILPAVTLATSMVALLVSGATAVIVLRQPPSAVAAPAAALTAALSGPQSSSLQTLPAPPAPSVAPTAAAGSATQGASTRIAQSQDGSIYAFDPGTELAFRFDPTQPGPTPIAQNQIPADIQARLLQGAGAGGDMAIDPATVDARAAQASAALAAQSTDQSRPPLNQILSDPEITSSITASLNEAQGIVRPAASDDVPGSDPAWPVIYAFFDPQCPYCHAAFEALDGQYAVKWMPLSALGPRSDPLNAHIIGPMTSVEESDDAGGTRVRQALADDAERGERLAAIMRDETKPTGTELDDAQRFVLDENAEFFRLLSQGAEELRAVPTFLVMEPDGTATWLRGFEESTSQEIADIVAGKEPA